VVLDFPLTDKNVFFWWPDAEGNAPDPREIEGQYVRFTFDPKATDLNLPTPEVILPQDMEFPRIDDRIAMARHRHSFFDTMAPQAGTDFAAIAPVLGGGHAMYNALGHLDHETGKLEMYFPGRTHMVQEPVFAPRSQGAPEGDGFLIVLVNNYATMSSELHVVDTRDFSVARAIVLLPLRLRAGLHGNWVDAKEVAIAG
jgi:carotenoid cleavage dioxygenase